MAVDPGRHGAIAIWDTHRENFPRTGRMPATDTEAAMLLMETDRVEPRIVIFAIEKPPLFTGRPLPGSRIALLFQNYGVLLGAALAMEWEIHTYSPQTWQKTFGVGSSRGLTASQWKGKLKEVAIQRFPQNKVTNDNADALLILAHLRQSLGGVMAVAEEND